jgi:hypothetical protein
MLTEDITRRNFSTFRHKKKGLYIPIAIKKATGSIEDDNYVEKRE